MEFYYGVSNSSSLYHFGTKEHSGRYKWGSGDRPYQRLGGKERRKLKKADKKLMVEDYKDVYREREGRKLTRGEKKVVDRRTNEAFRRSAKRGHLDELKDYVDSRKSGGPTAEKDKKIMTDAIKRYDNVNYLNKEYPGERGKIETFYDSQSRYRYIKKHDYAFTVKEEAQAKKEFHRSLGAYALGFAATGIVPPVGAVTGFMAKTGYDLYVFNKRLKNVEEDGRLTYNQYAQLYNKKYANEISSGDKPAMSYIGESNVINRTIEDKDLEKAIQRGTVVERDKRGRATRVKLNV